MKIYDCFTYFNEEEILRIHLEEMDSAADYFVIVESSETFTGKEKPFYFDDIPNWIDRWKDKIIRVRLDGFPHRNMTTWERETFQRNAIMQGLHGANGRDVIIIGDVDEIPRASKIKLFSRPGKRLRTQLDVDQFFWNFNWKVPQHCNQGARPVLVTIDDMNATPQELRAMQVPRVPNAGWHFSFFSDCEKIKTKIESFAHSEYNLDEFKEQEKILYRIENGVDPFDRFPLKFQEIDETYPKYVQENYGK